jgi:transcription elongation factor Elf1
MISRFVQITCPTCKRIHGIKIEDYTQWLKTSNRITYRCGSCGTDIDIRSSAVQHPENIQNDYDGNIITRIPWQAAKSVSDYWNQQMPMMAMYKLAGCAKAISEYEQASHSWNIIKSINPDWYDKYVERLQNAEDEVCKKMADVYISLAAYEAGLGLNHSKITGYILDKLEVKYKNGKKSQ